MKKFLSILSASLIIQLIGIITGVMLARQLGPEIRGLWGKIIFIPGLIANVSAFGLDSYFSRSSIKKEFSKNLLINFSVYYSLILGGLGVVIAIILQSILYFPTVNNSAYIITCFYIPFAALNLLILSIELGHNRIFYYNLSRISFSIFNLFFLIILWGLNIFDIYLLSIFYVVVAIMSSLLSVFLSGYKPKFVTNEQRQFGLNIMTNAFPYGVGSIFFLILSQVPNAVSTIFLPSKELGYFLVGITASSIHGIVGNTLGKVLLSAENKTNSFKVIKISIYSYLLIGIGLLIFLPYIIKIVFGEQFVESSNLSVYIIPFTILMAINDFYDDFLKSQNIVRHGIYARICSIMLFLLIGIPVIIKLGLKPYLFVLNVVEIFRFFWMVKIFNSKFEIKFRELFQLDKSDLAYVLKLIKR